MPPESVFSRRGKLEYLCLDHNKTGLGTARSALIGDMEPQRHLRLDDPNSLPRDATRCHARGFPRRKLHRQRNDEDRRFAACASRMARAEEMAT